MTSVTLENTPSMVTTNSPGSTGMVATYNGYTPLAGDTLVALVAAASTNGSISATAEHSGTTGWAKQFEIFNVASGTSSILVAMWTRSATGGDAAPTFTASATGGSSAGAVTLAALGNTGPTSWDGTGSYNSGSSSATISTVTVTTTANVTDSGDYALAALARGRTTGSTATYSSSAWTTLAATGASSILQLGVDGLANPSTGSTASDTGTWGGTSTTAFAAALAVVFKVPSAGGSPEGNFFLFF